MSDQPRFQRLLQSAFAFPVMLSLILAALLAWRVNATLNIGRNMDQGDHLIVEAGQLHRLLVDAESGMWGYHLYRDSNFLEPFTDAIERIPRSRERVKTLLTRMGQANRLEEFDRFSRELADWLATAQKGLPSESEAIRQKRQMDRLQMVLESIVHSELELRDTSIREARRISRLALATGCVLALVLGLFLAFYSRTIVVMLGRSHNHALQNIRASAARSDLLARVSEKLASSLDSSETLTALCRQITDLLADCCCVHLTDGAGNLILKGASNRNPLSPETPCKPVTAALTEAVQTGKTRIFEDPNAGTTVSVPMNGRERVFGTLTFFWNSPLVPKPREETLWLLEEIAYRTALALENTRHFEDARGAIRLRDDFISIASHELKTPLTLMKLQTQIHARMLNDRKELPASAARDFLSLCLRQIGRLQRLVEDMLDVGRLSQGAALRLQFEPVDLGELASEVISTHHELLQEAGCEARVNAPEGADVTVRADRFRLEQALTNLLSNAMKYGPGQPIDIQVGRADDRGWIRVTDHGVGIAPEHQERIFKRFERVTAENGGEPVTGLGLGLYIAREIVRSHRGTIQLNSEPGAGSSFTVELPVG